MTAVEPAPVAGAVGPQPGPRAQAQPPAVPEPRPDVAGGRARALVRAARPRQWVKNGLAVGAPLAAGRIAEPRVLAGTALAVTALTLVAAATYLANDLHDRHEDRLHPVKRSRPIASGALPVPLAATAAVLLGAGGLAVAAVTSLPLLGVVVGYLAVTTAYSYRLRREPVLELVAVAAGFVLRSAAGGAAVGIPVSPWFLLVAGFGALFLVAGKRYAELEADRGHAGRRVTLAAYSAGYLRFVWAAAATLTVVVYLLWANQVYSVREDGTWAFWSLVPFVLAVLRYALAVDGGGAEAPEDLALGDRTLQLLAVCWLVMLAVGASG